jgi:uncharacterized protein (DUF58 family)
MSSTNIPEPAEKPTSVSPTRFIDPTVLSRIENLELLARTVVEGFVQGLHKSPFLGFSVDFAEYRPYQPGDVLRSIDWNIYGRLDRLMVKLFDGETNTHVNFLMDISGSMAYGSGEVPKINYAKYLTASLVYFAHRQRDGVGLVTFDTEVTGHIPAGRRHGQLMSLLTNIDRAEASKETEFRKPLDYMTEFLKKRGIVVLISDLYDEVDNIVSAIKTLRAKGNDVIIFHILDDYELNFPFQNMTEFEDLETTKKLNVIPGNLRKEYLQLIHGHIAALEKEFSAIGVDYTLMNSSKPLDHGLFRYLAKRAKSKNL